MHWQGRESVRIFDALTSHRTRLMNRFEFRLLTAMVATTICGPLQAPAGDVSPLDYARQLNEVFVQVAERVSPSVVVISVIQKPAPPQEDEEEDSSSDSLPPGFWREFHKRFRQERPDSTYGQGSGIIIRKDGYILTNRHVVEEAESINVRLRDGRTFKAALRGMDPQSDVAVIKIEGQDLPAATLADSSATRVGEFAIAIGAPFSLDYSVTIGHVSAKSRSNVIEGFEGASMDQDFIQTDAQINPGNSGGPLVNLNGEVIGINTLIHGLRTGIGFAIPSNLAKEVSDQLIARGKFVRPWLGVGIRALRDQPELKERLKGVDDGVVVSRIMPDGPAAKSQLRTSDIITAVDGKSVGTPQELRSALRPKPVGEPVTLKVYRNGKTVDVKLSPAEWVQNEPKPVIKAKAIAPPKQEPAKLGVSVQALTAELASKLDVPDQTTGVLVASVEKNSLALGRLKAGDVIVSVDQKPITTPKEFQDAMKAADLKKGALLNILSGKDARFEIFKQK